MKILFLCKEKIFQRHISIFFIWMGQKNFVFLLFLFKREKNQVLYIYTKCK